MDERRTNGLKHVDDRNVSTGRVLLTDVIICFHGGDWCKEKQKLYHPNKAAVVADTTSANRRETLIYANLCYEINFCPHLFDNSSHCSYGLSAADGAQWLLIHRARSASPFAISPPAQLNPVQKPFDVSLPISPSKLWNLNFLIRATSICQKILFIDLTEIEQHELQQFLTST